MVEILSAEEARDIHLKTSPELTKAFNEMVKTNEDGFEVRCFSNSEIQLYTWIVRNKTELEELGYTIDITEGGYQNQAQWSVSQVVVKWHEVL